MTLFPLGLKSLQLYSVCLHGDVLDFTRFERMTELSVIIDPAEPPKVFCLPPSVEIFEMGQDFIVASDAVFPSLTALILSEVSCCHCFAKAFVPCNWPKLSHFQGSPENFCSLFKKPWPLDTVIIMDEWPCNEGFMKNLGVVAGPTLQTLAVPGCRPSFLAFPKLRVVNTSFTKSNFNSFLCLRGTLQELTLTNARVETLHLQTLTKFHSLESLSLRDPGWRTKSRLDISVLAASAPNLRFLELYMLACDWEYFQFPRLETLLLAPLSCFRWWPGLAQESTCSLRHLRVVDCFTRSSDSDVELCESLVHMDKLLSLALSNFGLNFAPVKAKALQALNKKNPDCVVLRY